MCILVLIFLFLGRSSPKPKMAQLNWNPITTQQSPLWPYAPMSIAFAFLLFIVSSLIEVSERVMIAEQTQTQAKCCQIGHKILLPQCLCLEAPSFLSCQKPPEPIWQTLSE